MKRLITADLKVSEIVLENPYFILMLEHFGIGLVVQEKTVEQLCRENNVEVRLLLTFANLFNGIDTIASASLSHDDVPAIIQYLKTSHQYYRDEKLPRISELIEEMSTLNTSTEIRLVRKFFRDYRDEIELHLNYENEVVFPYIMGLYHALTLQKGDFSSTYSVKEYQEHHNDIEEKLTDLKNLLIKYLPLQDDQQVRRRLLFSLFELEYDLNIHSRIEDEIIIPLSEAMEHNPCNAT